MQHADIWLRCGAGLAASRRTALIPTEVECVRCDADDIGYVDAAGPVRKRSKIPGPSRRKVSHATDIDAAYPVVGRRISTSITCIRLELGGSHDESNLLTLCEGHHLARAQRKAHHLGVAPDVRFEFAKLEQPANRFAISKTRAVETQRALEQLGFSGTNRPRPFAARPTWV